MKDESKILRKRLFRLRSLVDEILQEHLNRRLYKLSATDELRLFKLLTWRDRYKVPIKFILCTLVPYYAEKFKGFSVRNDGIGCKIATLLGKKSEVMLRDAIVREYPNGEHIELWNYDQQLSILATEQGDDDEEEFLTKPKSFLHYEHPHQYIRAYGHRVDTDRKQVQKALSSLARKDRLWRGNPFI